MPSEIPLSPMGRKEIHQLEYALLIGALFRPEVMEALKNPTERLTWLDSLAVAAAAVARDKAKMPIGQIADELGRTEATIRNHITGRTEAGKLILKTYQEFAQKGVKLEVTPIAGEERIKELKERLKEIASRLKAIEETISQLAEKL